MPEPGSAQALGGLHHVTAITGALQDNLDFYTRVFGLRLVKRTVNQDDVSAYHLFYADAVGSPGTDLTFFHWPNAPSDVRGAGSVARITFAVPGGSLPWWRARLASAGTHPEEAVDGRGRPVVRFADPEGQRLEIVAVDGGPNGVPWAGSPVPVEHSVRGMLGVTLETPTGSRTREVMLELLGYRATPAPSEGDLALLVPGVPSPTEIWLQPTRRQRGRPGRGGVHHVAFRTPDDPSQHTWLARLRGAGVPNSGIVDRYYFRSLYFREPGGILFEIATDGPGFGSDEPVEHLGERLALPPFLEPHRATIEAGLPPLEAPAGVDRRD